MAISLPTTLQLLNVRLSFCLQTADFTTLGLEKSVSFERFLRTILPLIWHFSKHPESELKSLKVAMVQLFPINAENRSLYQLFSSAIELLKETPSASIAPETRWSIVQMIVETPPAQRVCSSGTPKERVCLLQQSLNSLLVEGQLIATAPFEKYLIDVTTHPRPEHMDDPKVFGPFIRYMANITIALQALDQIFRGKSKFYPQYLDAKAQIDFARDQLSLPLKTCDELARHAWEKFHVKPGTSAVVDLSVVRRVAPLGYWILDGKPKDDQFFIDLTNRYPDYYRLQAILYQSLYQELRSIYSQHKAKRELIFAFQRLDTSQEKLPEILPENKPPTFPNLGEFMTALPPQVPATKPTPLFSYSRAIAEQISSTEPISDEMFWKLAARQFTLAVDRFSVSGRKASFIHVYTKKSPDDVYMLPAQFTRHSTQETKRGVIYWGIDNGKVFYRLFEPLVDTEILKRVAGISLSSDLFCDIQVASSHREGEVQLTPPPPLSFDNGTATIIDDRLGVTIQLFQIN